MKINIEEIKKYKNAVNTGSRICYRCGEVDPECGFTPLIQSNLSRDEISTELCNVCYNKIWKEAEKSDIKPEDIWGLNQC